MTRLPERVGAYCAAVVMLAFLEVQNVLDRLERRRTRRANRECRHCGCVPCICEPGCGYCAAMGVISDTSANR